jgi:hypothetical protein
MVNNSSSSSNPIFNKTRSKQSRLLTMLLSLKFNANASHVSHMSHHDFDASYVLMRNKIRKVIALHIGTHHKR